MTEQLLLLIKLILAHLASDFLFQTKNMSEQKGLKCWNLYIHGLIVFLCTLLASFSFIISGIITVLHLIIDIIKHYVTFEKIERKYKWFLIDQILHLLTIASVWFFFNPIITINETWNSFIPLTNNLDYILIATGYLLITYPIGFLLENYFENEKLKNKKSKKDSSGPPITESEVNQVRDNSKTEKTEKTDNAGRTIGILERIIIFTLVLINQYEAIGFLIAGKSILRFSNQDEDKKSEYVLKGTLISFSIAILLGLSVKLILGLPLLAS